MGSYDGQVVGAGFDAIDPSNLIDSANIVAHYKFDGDITDSSGNGYDLQIAAGRGLSYVRGCGAERKAALFYAYSRLELINSAHNANFRLTDTMSVIALIKPISAGTLGTIAHCGPATPSALDVDNILWYAGRGPEFSTGYEGGLYGGWEYTGGGSHESVGTDHAVPREWSLVSFYRGGSSGAWTLNFSVNGRMPSSGAGAGDPVGGSNSNLSIGATANSTNFLDAYMQDLIICDDVVTDAALVTEAKRIGMY